MLVNDLQFVFTFFSLEHHPDFPFSLRKIWKRIIPKTLAMAIAEKGYCICLTRLPELTSSYTLN